MLPRCGRAAHICEANCILQSVFPAAIALFKTCQFKQSWMIRIKVANSNKATGQLQHAGRQKQGWNPLLPDAENHFPKSCSCIVSCKHCSWEYHPNPVRQNRFAVCLCAVRRWLRYPNCLWMFLRLQFTGIFYVSRMANSICLLLLDFNFISSIPLLRGTACPP